VPGTKRAVGNWQNGFFSSFVGPQTSIRPCLGCKQGRLLAGLLGSRGLFFWSWPAIQQRRSQSPSRNQGHSQAASAMHDVFLSQVSELGASTSSTPGWRLGEALHASRLPVAARVSRTFSLPRNAQFYSISSSRCQPAIERWFQRSAGGDFLTCFTPSISVWMLECRG